jgi:DNA (cytosine-5)-methyltransferase 1
LILLGARRGLQLPDYPEPLVCPADGERVARFDRGPACRDALGDLPDADAFPVLLDTDETPVGRWGKASQYAQEMRCLTNDCWHFGYPRRWQSNIMTSSTRTGHSDISRRRFAATPANTNEPISRFFKLDANGLSNTLRAGTDSARGAFTSPRPIHYALPRCVTVREMARLHGFPDWFRFHATKWHGARQIGNAVPPPLARAVAGQAMVALGREPIPAAEAIPLGDPALLRLDMSRAAARFQVDAPIGRRDRKSGARKRKQHEIEAGLAKGQAADHAAD